FSDRQMTSTVAWHASSIVIAALVVGVPVGVIGSAWLWQAFADEIGVDAPAHSPVVLFAAIVVAAIVVAGLAAIVPGRTARRLTSAALLRSE
ncbi:MAG: hypothetical protein JWN99_984, partial [Ilumatobacteraceae bacterium]|nr:hypothetical protein [Ilumatobacteraceae bacterium]